MKNAYAAIAFALVTATSLAAADEIATEAMRCLSVAPVRAPRLRAGEA